MKLKNTYFGLVVGMFAASCVVQMVVSTRATAGAPQDNGSRVQEKASQPVRSLIGKSLVPPAMSPSRKEKLERDLAEARANYQKAGAVSSSWPSLHHRP